MEKLLKTILISSVLFFGLAGAVSADTLSVLSATIGAQNPNPVYRTQSAVYPVTVNFSGVGTTCSADVYVQYVPTGITSHVEIPNVVPATSSSVTTTVTLNTSQTTNLGPWTFTVIARPTSGCGPSLDPKAMWGTINTDPQGTPTLSLSSNSVSYNGTTQAASVVGSVPGTVTNVKYNGLSQVPTAAGVYTVTADFVPNDTVRYSSLSGASAGTWTIKKVDPICTVTGYNVNFDNQAHTATGSCKGVLNETLTTLDLSGTTHTAVGSYSDSWIFTDSSGNYNNTSGAVTDGIVGVSVISASVGSQTPDPVYRTKNATYPVTVNFSEIGSACSADISVQYVPQGVTYHLDSTTLIPSTETSPSTTLTLTSGPNTPTGPWTFTVIARPTSGCAGSLDPKAMWGTINTAALIDPTISLSNVSTIYNGTTQAASVVGSVPGTVTNVKYNGSSQVPTAAGVYTVTADFTPNDTAQYSVLSGASAGTWTITKASAICNVTGYDVMYDGTAYTAAGSCTGVLGEDLSGLDLSGTSHTNVGSYNDTWFFVDVSGNYTDISGPAADNISKVTPALSLVSKSSSFNGTSQSISITSSVPGVVSNILYDGSSVLPTNAGVYAITASFVPEDSTNYASLSNALLGSFTITKVDPVCSISGYSVVYDGQSHVATGSCKGVSGETLSTLNLSATAHVDAGSHTDLWSFVDEAGNYNNASDNVSDVISKADQIITFASIPNQIHGTTIDLSPTINTGLPLSIVSMTPLVCTVSGTSISVIGLVDETCTIKVSQVGNDNYNPAEATQSFNVLGYGTANMSGLISGSRTSVSASGSLPLKFSMSNGSTPISFAHAAVFVNGYPAIGSGKASDGNLFNYDPTTNTYQFNLSLKNTLAAHPVTSGSTVTIKVVIDDGQVFNTTITVK